jgi:tetratricopeptide (TPR) repeat protein/tRNA A-37 threonylcarbamoyl transferase component Bud32
MSSNLPEETRAQKPVEVIEALAAGFLAQLQAGEDADRQALVRAHPELGDQLKRRLAFVEMVYHLGLARLKDQTSPGETAERIASSSGESTSLAPTRLAETKQSAWAGGPGSLPDYELLEELGHGGMGVVYKARQISLNRIVALKMISSGALASPATMARFQVEAEALASLQHPNIVQVYDVGVHDLGPYLAMEFLDGGSLAAYLAGRPQPPRAAAELVQTLARAIHCAHQRGIIHRDLKPANILLAGGATAGFDRAASPPGSRPLLVKITDFGLAKRLAGGKGQTSTGAVMGTPGYMAPEQAGGRVRDTGPPTDVYALGAILYEMLTGRPPFVGDTALDTLQRVQSEEPVAPGRFCPKLPRDLETICLKCLEKEPAKRYSTAEALADDLRRFLDGAPIAARPAGLGERAWKWAKRRPAWAALLGVIVAAAGGLAASYIRLLHERNRGWHSLQVARQAVNDLYTKMTTERLLDEPQFDPLCQELLDKARVLCEELAREHSADPGVRADIAIAWFQLGDIHRLRDQHDEAEQAYGEAIARQGKLCRDYPDEPRYRLDLANSHNWLGELLRERGRRLDEAEQHYRAALELQQQPAGVLPGNPSYRREQARSHFNLGIVERDTYRLPEARADYDRAVELLTELHQADAVDPNVRHDLARALVNRGALARLGQRTTDARRDDDQAIKLLAGLHQEFPSRAIYKFELAIARQNRGNLLWSEGRNALAQRAHQEALALLQELVADFASRPRYQKKKGIVLKNLGTALASAGDRPGAERCWNQARDLFEALARQDPQNTDYHGLLAMTLGNLGWLRTAQDNWTEARRLIEQGIGQLHIALEVNPKHPDNLQELSSQYRDLAETLLHLRDHEAASQAATNLAGVFPERAQDSYYAACFMARCVPVALEDKGGDAPAQQAVARRYVQAAIAHLRQTAAQASPTLSRLTNERQYFRPLEADPEFLPVLRALNVKVGTAARKTGP